MSKVVGRVARLVVALLASCVAAPGLAVAASGGGILDPGRGIAPPGSGHLVTLVGYVAWGTFALCVVGVLITAAQMAVAHQRHGGAGEHAARLGWVLAACAVAGSASALVGALI